MDSQPALPSDDSAVYEGRRLALNRIDQEKLTMPNRKGMTMPLTNDEKTAIGEAIQATPKPSKERITVRVDTDTFAVYQGINGPRRRIGTVTHYVVNEANRTPTGGKYTSRRLTVRLRDDDRDWVGQFKNGEKTVVILRPLEEK